MNWTLSEDKFIAHNHLKCNFIAIFILYLHLEDYQSTRDLKWEDPIEFNLMSLTSIQCIQEVGCLN